MPKIFLTRPYIGPAEYRAVRRVLRSGWLTQGPETEALEEEFAQYVGSRGACAVSSATTALHLALRACEVGPGQEVIVPSHTFIATVHAVLYCGAIPRFIDIDERTYCLDPSKLTHMITSKTACIVVVHQMGFACDLDGILATAGRYGIPVVEDAACALGTEYFSDNSWTRIGKPHGDIACFSFHPRKVITCGEGGMITCRDPQLLERIRRLRQHGMSHTLHRPGQFGNNYQPVFSEMGYNYRLSDLAAAVLRCQLRRLPWILKRRRKLAERYHRAFRNISGCQIVHVPANTNPNYQSYPLRLSPEASISRDTLLTVLAEVGIEARPGIMNAHESAPYLRKYATCLEHSERAARNTLLLPLYPHMSFMDQSLVIRTIRNAITHASTTVHSRSLPFVAY